MHFGVRKLAVPYFVGQATEPSGVKMVESVDGDSLDQLGLKYPTPDVSEFDMADFLSAEQLRNLSLHLSEDRDNDDESIEVSIEREELLNLVLAAIDKQSPDAGNDDDSSRSSSSDED